MNKLICFIITLFMAASCAAQELEFCGSLSTSSEQRFQSSHGFGLQYQQNIGQKYRVGLGIHHNFKKSNFDKVPYIDAVPFPPSIERIHSESERFSFRINVQRLLRDNENLSISLGLEFSYNYLWNRDDINLFIGGSSMWNRFSEKDGPIKMLGMGIISKIEVKNFIAQKLSLCFTIRPEIVADFISAKGGDRVFSPGLSFTEFQLGLKYRFK